ncbi:MAG TPA: MFS transporter, partial [Clostridia bacterium]|nr:MFS transporter [Clostridia bacterium]
VLGNLFAGFSPMLSLELFPGLQNPYQLLLVVSASSYFILGITRMCLPRYSPSQNEKVNFREVIFDPGVLSFLLFGFVTMTIFNCVMSMMNIILRQRYYFQDSTIGIFFSVISIVGSLAMPLVSYLSSRFSSRRIAEVTLIVQALVIFVMAFSPAWIFVFMACTRTAATNFVYSVVDSPMLQSVTPSCRGSYSGLRICANYIGMSLGSVISGIFIAQEQYAMLFIFTGFLALVQNLVFRRSCVRHIHNYSR